MLYIYTVRSTFDQENDPNGTREMVIGLRDIIEGVVRSENGRIVRSRTGDFNADEEVVSVECHFDNYDNANQCRQRIEDIFERKDYESFHTGLIIKK